mmetsp:Transcript_1001/g.1196  ORF Transcript_1001/g.1196 Transcript_1001/m.1196 type:complete len:125 (-) Transcript_1001:1226-1600(-)
MAPRRLTLPNRHIMDIKHREELPGEQEPEMTMNHEQDTQENNDETNVSDDKPSSPPSVTTLSKACNETRSTIYESSSTNQSNILCKSISISSAAVFTGASIIINSPGYISGKYLLNGFTPPFPF